MCIHLGKMISFLKNTIKQEKDRRLYSLDKEWYLQCWPPLQLEVYSCNLYADILLKLMHNYSTVSCNIIQTNDVFKFTYKTQ